MQVHETQHAGAPAVSSSANSDPQVSRGNGQRVLVVEDDEILARFIDRLLHAEGFCVELVHSGDAALAALRPELDLVVLDLNLPDVDGIAVLQKLRERFQTLAVLVLTARSRSESAVLALESGADDCLTKPFSHTELVARMRALLRRHREATSSTPHSGNLVLDQTEFRVIRDGHTIDLTPREYGLLEYLMRSPGTPVSRAVLLRELWGDEPSSASNIVDVYMKYVRDKVDRPGLPKLIRTVRGIGYVLDEP